MFDGRSKHIAGRRLLAHIPKQSGSVVDGPSRRILNVACAYRRDDHASRLGQAGQLPKPGEASD